MQYYCFIYLDDATFADLSDAERAGWVNAMLDNDECLRQSGHYIASDGLKPPAAAVSVRVRSGELAMTDGPFAETKEYLSGFIKIEARDLNEAIQVAAGIPLARVGTIEVRPVDLVQRIALPE